MTTVIDQRVKARFLVGAVLILLALWMLRSFWPVLGWALVLAIVTWPVYRSLMNSSKLPANKSWIAAILTVTMAALVLLPLIVGMIHLLSEIKQFSTSLGNAQVKGVNPPQWFETLPWFGQAAKELWQETLGTPQSAANLAKWLGSPGELITYSKDLAGLVIHRFFSLLMILIVLFFVYFHGDFLTRQMAVTCQNLFGNIGNRYTQHAIAAVRATVSGMVLVGLGKGVLLGIGYSIAGLSQPAILGAITGIFALIPYAAKVIFTTCALYLFMHDQILAAIMLFAYGMALTFVADHFIRPALIGNAVRLPFVWTLLGIFGGLEHFGLLGLFLGPTLMSVVMSIWRDWQSALEYSFSKES